MDKKFFVFREAPVETQSHGVTLRGILTVPVTEADKIPVAVLTHRFLADNSNMAALAASLGKNGIASVRFNLMGVGNSDGSYSDATFTTEKQDVLSALAFARSLPFADLEHIFLIGKSQGGFDSALASLECEDDICALILWYPAVCIPDDFRRGLLQCVPFDPENIPERVNFKGLFDVNRTYILEGMAMDVLRDFTVFKKDVLLIHGTADPIVNYDYAVKLANAYPNARLVTIEGGSHGFKGEGAAKALDATLSFCDEMIVSKNRPL